MRMKITILALALVTLLAVVPRADALPAVNWSFDVTTFGADTFWTSPTAIDNAPLYPYDYVIATLEVQIIGLSWFDLTGLIPPADMSGSGTQPGPLPLTLASQSFAFPPYVNSADVFIGVDAAGVGQVSLTNISFGSGITGAHAAGNINITAVPEPASLLLLGLGMLGAAVRKRTRRVIR